MMRDPYEKMMADRAGEDAIYAEQDHLNDCWDRICDSLLNDATNGDYEEIEKLLTGMPSQVLCQLIDAGKTIQEVATRLSHSDHYDGSTSA